MEAFLSHSRKDERTVNNVYKICQRAKIKPNIAEFEEIENGKLDAKEIRTMIDKSELFLLFLSEHVANDKDYAKTIYTQNWVNFELGCAYAQKKEKKKFIYLFEPFNQLRFPIPYLDYYILHDPNYQPHWEYLEELFGDEMDYSKFTQSLNPLNQMFLVAFNLYGRLKGQPLQRPTDSRGFSIHHKKCGAKYILLSKPEQWYCPKCRKLTNWMP